MQTGGFVKLHRKLKSSSIWQNKDTKAYLVFTSLLLDAQHEDGFYKTIFKGKEYALKRGEVVTGRFKLARELGFRPRTTHAALVRLQSKYLMVDIKSDNKKSIITILNWDSYQISGKSKGQQRLQQSDNKVTTDGQQSDTKQEGKKERRKETYYVILDYLNQKTGSDFKRVERNFELIQGRLDEGYSVDDFKLVIDKKVAQWNKMPAQGQKDMRTYLRPSTLFRAGNFESYINEPEARTTEDPKEVVDKFMREHA